MVNYDEELSETIYLTENVANNFGDPIGIFINGTSCDNDYTDRVTNLYVKDELNCPRYFEMTLMPIESEDDVNLKEGNPVYLKSGRDFIFGGRLRIRNVEDGSELTKKINGYGYSEDKIIDRLVDQTSTCYGYRSSRKTQGARPQYEKVPSCTIVRQQTDMIDEDVSTKMDVESCTASVTSSSVPTDTIWLAQSFTAPSTGKITGVDIYGYFNIITSPDMVIEIRNDNAGVPGSTIYATGYIDAPFSVVEWKWRGIGIEPFSVTSGVTYWIVIRMNGAIVWPNSFNWAYNNGNPYPNGMAASSTDSGGSWITAPGTDYLFKVYFNPISAAQNEDRVSIRSEGDNVLSFIGGIAQVCDCDWYGFSEESGGSWTDYIATQIRGANRSLTTEFRITGTDQNAEFANRTSDKSSLVTSLRVYGAGDGVNQIESYADHCTNNRTYTTSDIESTGTTTFTVADGSSFGTTPAFYVWVGCEKMSVTRSGNTFTIVARGSDYRGNLREKPYAHISGSPVVDAQYTLSSPESAASSAYYNGTIERTFVSKETIDQSALDILAEKILLDRCGVASNEYSPPERISFSVNEHTDAIYDHAMPSLGYLISTGDYVTVTDDDAGLSGSYRIVASILNYENGFLSFSFECSNSMLTVLGEVKKNQDEAISMTQYMQGSTNTDSFSIDAVVRKEDPYYGIFTVPAEAVAINHIGFTWYAQEYRDNLISGIVAESDWDSAIILSTYTGLYNIITSANTTNSAFISVNFSGIIKSFIYGAEPMLLNFALYDGSSIIPGSAVSIWVDSVGDKVMDSIIIPYDCYGKTISLRGRCIPPTPNNWVNFYSGSDKYCKINARLFVPEYNTSTASTFNLYLCDSPSGTDPSAWSWTAYSGNPISDSGTIDLMSEGIITTNGIKGIKIESVAGSDNYTSRVFGSIQSVVYTQPKSEYKK